MLVKKGVPEVRTLAVGDGANDVAMITAAHIGVRMQCICFTFIASLLRLALTRAVTHLLSNGQ